MSTNNTLLGIAAGIVAGAFWGLVFLAPKLAADFPPLQLSAGRYLAYGLVAAVLVAPSWRRLRSTLGWREWRALAWLSFIGNILYYVLLARAVQTGGVAMTAFVIGLLPLAVTLVGSRERHAPALRALLPSLACSAAGLACISWQSLAASGWGSMTGLLCAGGGEFETVPFRLVDRADFCAGMRHQPRCAGPGYRADAGRALAVLSRRARRKSPRYRPAHA